MREADIINFMEINGFELVAKSEVNANPKDSANWPDGVWTLPPALRLKDVDRAKYEGIGESDRMTLLFKKRD
jgi:predicted methyltransferase